MKIGILTTDTLHHCYFIQSIAMTYPIDFIICETDGVKAPFETHHSFEDRRDEQESQTFFDGATPMLKDLFPDDVLEVESVNNWESKRKILVANPDVIIVFGTGKIDHEIIERCPIMLNLHGGDPERYRGLDSHLWALYHNDVSGLATCLHRVAPTLDTGEIVGLTSLKLEPQMGIESLRISNTYACIDLAASALATISRGLELPSFKQRKKGRYYSFMPACLKEVCVKKFDRLIKRSCS